MNRMIAVQIRTPHSFICVAHQTIADVSPLVLKLDYLQFAASHFKLIRSRPFTSVAFRPHGCSSKWTVLSQTNFFEILPFVIVRKKRYKFLGYQFNLRPLKWGKHSFRQVIKFPRKWAKHKNFAVNKLGYRQREKYGPSREQRMGKE